MNNSDFESPPLHWSVLSVVGAIATVITLIFALEIAADRLDTSPTYTLKATQVVPPNAVLPEVID